MEDLIIVAGFPFYVMGCVVAGFCVAKLIRSFNDSAVQTQLKETLPK